MLQVLRSFFTDDVSPLPKKTNNKQIIHQVFNGIHIAVL